MNNRIRIDLTQNCKTNFQRITASPEKLARRLVREYYNDNDSYNWITPDYKLFEELEDAIAHVIDWLGRPAEED